MTDKPLLNFNAITRVDPNHPAEDVDQLLASIDDLFQYHPWNADQVQRGEKVRDALKAAFNAIVANVPASATRTVALRKLLESRMDANAAITFEGNL